MDEKRKILCIYVNVVPTPNLGTCPPVPRDRHPCWRRVFPVSHLHWCWQTHNDQETKTRRKMKTKHNQTGPSENKKKIRTRQDTKGQTEPDWVAFYDNLPVTRIGLDPRSPRRYTGRGMHVIKSNGQRRESLPSINETEYVKKNQYFHI